MGSRDSKVRVHPSLPDTGLSVLSNSTEKEDIETGQVAPGGRGQRDVTGMGDLDVESITSGPGKPLSSQSHISVFPSLDVALGIF